MSVEPRPRTVRLVVEYDGTELSGWQVQEGPRSPPTVQGHLEAALERLIGHRPRVRGASRTDAGVHARGQVAAFETASVIPLVGFERGLRSFLPPSIAVRRAEEAPPGWNPRRSARGKRYVYALWCDGNPIALDRHRTWWVRGRVDLDAMRAGAVELVGTHDFEAFRAAGCVARHAVRTLHAVDVRGEVPGRVDIVVLGNAFVRNMVRILAGTLVEVGLGKRSPSAVERALSSRRRADAGVTAPAAGLCLDEVIYDDRLPPRPPDDADVAAAPSGRPSEPMG